MPSLYYDDALLAGTAYRGAWFGQNTTPGAYADDLLYVVPFLAPTVGTLTVTEDADTLAGSGTLAIVAAAAISEDADTLSAAATSASASTADATITEDADTLSAHAESDNLTPYLEEAMYATLGQYMGVNAIVGARIYPDGAPQSVRKPYIVMQEIATQVPQSLDGDVTSGGLDNFIVQVACYAMTQDEARALGREVRDAMSQATVFKSVHRDYRAMPQEQDTRLFCVQYDFSVWLRS